VAGRRDVVLAGHSSGSQSALRAARLVPGRLAGLVLANPTLDPRARHPVGLAVRLVDTVIHERLSELPDVLPWWLGSRGGSWLRLARSAITGPARAPGRRPAPANPVLTGAQDRFAPPEWAQVLARLVGADYATVPGAHNACFTSPAAADEVLHAFMRRRT
jgi:pimeloyl-ACP methyl ester carboxylesterase